MRAILFCVVILIGVAGCDSDIKTHQLFYGATLPPVVSITVGEVEAVKVKGNSGLSSPSIISPNRLAIVKMSEVLKGNGVGERIALAYEIGRNNEPMVKQKYVFFWDQSGRCVQYFSVNGRFYIKDGRELLLEDLRLR